VRGSLITVKSLATLPLGGGELQERRNEIPINAYGKSVGKDQVQRKKTARKEVRLAAADGVACKEHGE
jgi:hypothetical protein